MWLKVNYGGTTGEFLLKRRLYYLLTFSNRFESEPLLYIWQMSPHVIVRTLYCVGISLILQI